MTLIKDSVVGKFSREISKMHELKADLNSSKECVQQPVFEMYVPILVSSKFIS